MIWVNAAKKYLAAFAAQALDELEEMYADDIELLDWTIHTYGKDAALQADQDYFSNKESIKIHIQNTVYRDKFICIEFTLITRSYLKTDRETLLVPSTMNIIDIIEFNNYGKISSIRAYRR